MFLNPWAQLERAAGVAEECTTTVAVSAAPQRQVPANEPSSDGSDAVAVAGQDQAHAGPGGSSPGPIANGAAPADAADSLEGVAAAEEEEIGDAGHDGCESDGGEEDGRDAGDAIRAGKATHPSEGGLQSSAER